MSHILHGYDRDGSDIRVADGASHRIIAWGGEQMSISASDLTDVVSRILATLPESEKPRIAVVGAERTAVGAVISRQKPDAAVTLIDPALSGDDAHTVLSGLNPLTAIIDLDDDEARPRRFRSTFSHLATDGLWAALSDDRPTPGGMGEATVFERYVADVVAARAPDAPRDTLAQRDLRFLAECVGEVTETASAIVVVNRRRTLAKMRESQMNDLLDHGSAIGEVVERTPSARFTSRSTILANDESVLHDDKAEYTPPELALRAYSEVLCISGGAAVSGNLLLPESFRHNQQPRLLHRAAPSRTHYFSSVPRHEEPRRLEGTYFYLDGEYRGHFGHFVSEQISRLWALPAARRRFGDVKILMSHRRGSTGPTPWELEFLSTFDVGPGDIVSFTDHESFLVERLIGCTPMYSMPDYVHPDIAEVWDRIGDGLEARAEITDVPSRVFLKRPADAIRPCHNEADVLARFVAAGFTPVQPEELSLPDQVALFRGAGVIAGYAGSAMLGLLYRREPVTALVVGPDSYRANNEDMVSAVRGHTLVHIVSKGDIAHPEGGWSWDAFYGGFTFDPEREGAYLDEMLSELDRTGGIAPRRRKRSLPLRLVGAARRRIAALVRRPG